MAKEEGNVRDEADSKGSSFTKNCARAVSTLATQFNNLIKNYSQAAVEEEENDRISMSEMTKFVADSPNLYREFQGILVESGTFTSVAAKELLKRFILENVERIRAIRLEQEAEEKFKREKRPGISALEHEQGFRRCRRASLTLCSSGEEEQESDGTYSVSLPERTWSKMRRRASCDGRVTTPLALPASETVPLKTDLQTELNS